MDWITRQTRGEAYLKRPVTRKALILQVLKDKGPCTARQIAWWLCANDLNFVKPRLTELRDEGKIRAVKKVLDFETNRNVALWEVVDDTEELDQD